MVQSAKSRPDLADRLKKNSDDNTDLYSLMRNRHLSSQVIAIPTLSGGASSSSSGGTSGLLKTEGDTMLGPIAFHPVLTIIDDNQINIGKNSGFYSSRVIVTPEAGATDNLVTITGAAFSGQLLFMQGVATDTLTLIDATSNQTDWVITTGYVLGNIIDNGGIVYSCKQAHNASATDEPGVGVDWEDFWYQGNIETIDGNDFTLADDDIIIFMFDTTDNRWQQVTIGKQGSTGGGGGHTPWTTDRVAAGNNLVTSSDGLMSLLFDTNGRITVNRAEASNSILDIQSEVATAGVQVAQYRLRGLNDAGTPESIVYANALARCGSPVDGSESGSLEIRVKQNTSATTQIMMNFDGENLQIDTHAPIIPDSNAAHSLGTASLAFDIVHQAIAQFDANTGITSNVPSIGNTASSLSLNAPMNQEILFAIEGTQEASLSASGLILSALNSLTFLATNDASISKIGTGALDLISPDGFTIEVGAGANQPNRLTIIGELGVAANVGSQIIFQDDNAANLPHEYGLIKMRSNVVTTGSEAGGMEFEVYEAGTARQYLNLDGENSLVSIGGGGTLDSVRVDINGTTAATFDESGGSPRLLFNSGTILDVNANAIINVNVLNPEPNSDTIKLPDETVMHALTGFTGFQTSSTQVSASVLTNAANVGVMQLPYKVDTDDAPDTATLNSWFGDQNGCIGVQFDDDTPDVTSLWVRSNGSWVRMASV